MTQVELIADVLDRNLALLKMTLADFTDADIMVRPVPGANHAAWQLGHLANATSHLMNMVKPGAGAEMPAGFAEKFKKETASNDDANFFPKKDALLAELTRANNAAVAWIKTLTPADLDKPGPERMLQMVPTVGHMCTLFSGHLMMHIGQFQVTRRKLGRPVLF